MAPVALHTAAVPPASPAAGLGCARRQDLGTGVQLSTGGLCPGPDLPCGAQFLSTLHALRLDCILRGEAPGPFGCLDGMLPVSKCTKSYRKGSQSNASPLRGRPSELLLEQVTSGTRRGSQVPVCVTLGKGTSASCPPPVCRMGSGAGFAGGAPRNRMGVFPTNHFLFPQRPSQHGPAHLDRKVRPPHNLATPPLGGRPTETPTQAQPRARTRAPRAASVTLSPGGRIPQRPSASGGRTQSGIPITNGDHEAATGTHRDLQESQKSNADQ